MLVSPIVIGGTGVEVGEEFGVAETSVVVGVGTVGVRVGVFVIIGVEVGIVGVTPRVGVVVSVGAGVGVDGGETRSPM